MLFPWIQAIRAVGLTRVGAMPPLEPSNGDCYVVTSHFVEKAMHIGIEYEQEQDGRWLAEVPQLPGVLVYGATANEAMVKAETLALQVLAELT